MILAEGTTVLRRPLWAVAVAFCSPLGVAGLLVPFRATFTDAAAALGFIAAVSACLWFDFFLTRTYERLVITGRPDIEIAVSLLVVGVVVTELAARSRSSAAGGRGGIPFRRPDPRGLGNGGRGIGGPTRY